MDDKGLPGRRMRLHFRSGIAARVRAWTASIWRAEDGVSALEFALFAPVLFTGLVATADVGLAIAERMALDHMLRAGAQSAMADEGPERVEKVIRVAGAANSDSADPAPISISVQKYMGCDMPAGSGCSPDCPDSASDYIYYCLSLEKSYRAMILPDMTFRPSLQIQVR